MGYSGFSPGTSWRFAVSHTRGPRGILQELLRAPAWDVARYRGVSRDTMRAPAGARGDNEFDMCIGIAFSPPVSMPGRFATHDRNNENGGACTHWTDQMRYISHT